MNTDRKPTPETRSDALRRITNRALANISQHNIAFAVRSLEQRDNAGVRPSSNYAYLLDMTRFDRFLGRPFETTTPDDVTGFLRDYKESRAPETVRTMAIHLKVVLKEAFKLRESKDMPWEFRQALKVQRSKGGVVRGAIVPEAAFLAALDAIPRYVEAHAQFAPWATELVHAFLWLLWDSGMRISEALSLCISDVTLDEGTHTAKLQLRAEKTVSHGLKTGARYVIVRDAVPALKAWLAVHPGRLDGESPLITSLCYFRHVRMLNSDSANFLIRDVFALVGAKPAGKRKQFSPHDFRHTAATRDARHGYREPALRLKYGWSGNSPMPAHYVHLSEDDARERVLATPTTGAPKTQPAPAAIDVAAALAAFNAAAAALTAAMGAQAGAPA